MVFVNKYNTTTSLEVMFVIVNKCLVLFVIVNKYLVVFVIVNKHPLQMVFVFVNK